MLAFIRENTWSPQNELLTNGWGNGYIALEKDHEWYEKDYQNIFSSVTDNIHGGLTFSRKMDANELEETATEIVVGHIKPGTVYWVIGYDTAHFNDSLATWPREMVKQHTIEFYKAIKKEVPND